MSDTFEIKSDDIDVQEIMEKIRDNIRKRKEQGAYNAEEEKLIRSIAAKEVRYSSVTSSILDQLEKTANIGDSSYTISSHRKVIGPILVHCRQIINREIRRYVDPTIAKQGEFNAILVNYLRSLDDKTSRLAGDTEERLKHMEEEMSDKFRRSEIEANDDLDKKKWLAAALDKRINADMNDSSTTPRSASEQLSLDYVGFENRFRGTREEIKNRQSGAFFKYFKGCKHVLDIGCGRGEFLEILRDNGINARGIDLDENMVGYCESKGLMALKADAIEYLSGIDDRSLDGIFIDQVIEHLEPDYLIRMLMLCHSKLTPGACLVAETVNPVSFVSLANFYIDMTHKKPVHPETMRFLLEYCRFKDISLQFLSPLQGDMILEKIAVDANASAKERQTYELYNKNADKLNSLLFGAQDYAVIGKK